MMSELKQQESESNEIIKKARAYDKVIALLNNAICSMYENNMPIKEIADYLGTDRETLVAVDNEDFEYLAKEQV